jgi:predicted MFS family arabinose efflux permease
MVCSGIGALIIYYFQHYHADKIIFSYSILLTLSFFVGMYSVYTFTRVQDVSVKLQDNLSFMSKLVRSLKNKQVRLIILSLSLLNFSMCFVTPFFSAFMLKFLSYSAPLVVLYTCLSQLTYILSSRYWGKVTDRKDCIATLVKGLSAFAVSIVCFALSIYACPTLAYIILFFTHILLGFATFALKLVMNNIPLKYVPQKDAPIYISVINVSKSFAAVISGICSGVFLSLLEKWISSSGGTLNMSWTLFWGMGIILCILTIKQSRRL